MMTNLLMDNVGIEGLTHLLGHGDKLYIGGNGEGGTQETNLIVKGTTEIAKALTVKTGGITVEEGGLDVTGDSVVKGAFDVQGNIEKEEKERKAADKLFGQLPENQGKHLRKLWEEFDEAKTPDARYAAALDRLQPFIHNLCTEGHTWVQGKVTKEQVYKRSGLSMEVLPALKPWMEEQINFAIKKGWIVE